eukprot:1160813-Pelagomonas_calceolata.AAC.2
MQAGSQELRTDGAKHGIAQQKAHLDVAVQIGNELLLLMAHTRAEVGDPQVSLLAVAQIRLGDEDVSHGEHALHRGRAHKHMRKVGNQAQAMADEDVSHGEQALHRGHTNSHKYLCAT